MKKLILGTRGSALALAQAKTAAEAITSAWPGIQIEQKIIKTTGDQRLDVSLIDAPGLQLDRGLFTKEIEEALLAGTIDFAVHSLKDLPTTLPAGLEFAAVLPREDTRDVAILREVSSCEQLPPQAALGTSSVRRRAQLRERYPNLDLREIRGNVPTRLDKLVSGQFDGIVLAAAGLLRLGYSIQGTLQHGGKSLHVETLDWMLPAVGQGAIAIEIREGDTRVLEVLKKIHHSPTRIGVEAERALLRRMGGGCQVALGVRTRVTGDTLELETAWYPEGSTVAIRDLQSGPLDQGLELAASAAIDLMRKDVIK